jgi:two-component system sensor histidine kinase HydH
VSSVRNKKIWTLVPPWIVLGAVLILLPIFVFMTVRNIQREKAFTTKLMLEKGGALIRSFEAGARTGMMGMMDMQWGGQQVQRLLTETSQQPDIVYIMVTDTSGKILAHSDPEKVGTRYDSGLDLVAVSKSQSLQFREISRPNQTPVLEIYREFSPTRGYGGRFRGRMMMNDWFTIHGQNPADTGQVIFVGLDMGPVVAARMEDIRHTIVMGLTLLLIGFAGVVLLFVTHAYRTASATLSRVKALSDSLVENMPIGLLAIDETGVVASFNQAAEAILHRPAETVILRRPEEILPMPLAEMIRELKDRGGPIERELLCSSPGGHELPLEVIGTNMREEGGGFMGHVVLFRDLTEIQRLKEEVLRAQRLASIGRLAAGVAHEIRNPLSSIKGFATYFRERYREVPEDKQTAEIMIQEVERLNRVVGQLLELARPLNVERRPTGAKSLIQHSLRLVESQSREKGIQVKATIDEGITRLMIDPDRIQQALLNLYLNGIEAMDPGGTLAVAVRKAGGGTKGVEISVSDTGKGIGEEDLVHIFDPYFTTKASGTGLGLAIVHKVVESHGGEVRAESEKGKGTKVVLTLPHALEVGHDEKAK